MIPRQLGFQVDLARCVGCRACERACHHQHPDTVQGFRRVRQLDDGGRTQSFLTMACNHCESPECIRVCPANCYDKRRDGIVIHHSGYCTGCGRCVGACPFHAPQLIPRTDKADKCDLCHQRLEAGQRPHCVEACPMEALQVIEISGVTDAWADYPLTRYTQPSIRFIKARQPVCFWRKGTSHGETE